MNIAWFGPQDNCSAFGLVNRRYCEALELHGHTVNRNFFGQSTVAVSSTYPPQEIGSELPKALFTVWEFGGVGAVPASWKVIAATYNSVFTNSKWVGRVFTANALHDVCSVRACIPEHIFKPKRTEHSNFRFLWAGGSDKRHGLDVILEVFHKHFANKPGVELVIKLHPNYPVPHDLLNQWSAENIRVITGCIDMPELYAECDCVVLPMRGTSKSFIALEAMACGLPAILTAGSGLLALSKYSYPLIADLQQTTHHIHKDTSNLWWFEPNKEHLASLMEYVLSNQEEARQRGLSISDIIRSEYGYQKAGSILARSLNALQSGIKVSIVILAHQVGYLDKCVDSIIEHTPGGYEIIIIDNAISDWEYAVDNATKHPYNKVYRSAHNLGVSLGRNRGLSLARGEYTLFLDDDAVITQDGWLDKMLSYFKDPRVGIVGQTGYYIKEWGLFWESQGVTECDVVQGYCQMFPTRFRDEIGLLDENYGRFWHEDSDWCLRIKERGYKVIDCDNVGVHHIGSGRVDDTYMQKLRYLTQKWAGKPQLLTPRGRWDEPYQAVGV